MAGEADAQGWLERAGKDPDVLVDGAIAAVNQAIAAYRVSAADLTSHEVGPESVLAIRIGFGTGDHVAGSGWIEAVRLPPERRHKRRPGTEDIRPPQRMAAILSGRDSIDEWELHALRARVDHDNGRAAEAAAEIHAAIAAFDASPPDFAANLREEIAGRLAAAREVFGSAVVAIPGAPAPHPEALADAVDLFTRLQNRRRRPPAD